jgi:hypothetical protein
MMASPTKGNHEQWSCCGTVGDRWLLSRRIRLGFLASKVDRSSLQIPKKESTSDFRAACFGWKTTRTGLKSTKHPNDHVSCRILLVFSLFYSNANAATRIDIMVFTNTRTTTRRVLSSMELAFPPTTILLHIQVAVEPNNRDTVLSSS